MSIGDTRTGTPLWRLAVLVLSVIVMTIGLTWTYLGMRSVMDVGGSCAEGGPYVSAQSCPDGATLLSVAIPIMLVAVFAGSAMGVMLKAPTLLLPMWAALFGSLGWNFFDYGLNSADGVVISWIVCGVVFWLMAAPALLIIPKMTFGNVSPTAVVSEQVAGPGTWWAVYVVFGITGLALGVWSFNSWT